MRNQRERGPHDEHRNPDAVRQQGAPAPSAATNGAGATRKGSRAKAAPKARKGPPSQPRTASCRASTRAGAKSAKQGATASAKKPRPESKGAQILELIGRAKGATLAEIMRVTKWQAHSVRGFLSTAAKKHRIDIASARNEAGERTYKVGR